MNNHLDIGTIQAFLDRELSQAASTRVSSHVAACDSCAILLAQAEDESAIVFPALEREFNTLVPTQRLWTKINDALETERREAPFWHKAWGYLRLSLLSPSMAVAAGLILVIGIFAILWMSRTTTVTNEPPVYVAQNVAPTITAPSRSETSPPASETAPPISKTVEPTAFKAERASYRPETKRPVVESAVASQAAPVSADPMPGEESYVKTIATLSKAVDEKKDSVLRPSQLIASERDMAVVNDSITKMREEVKRNPKNQSARQVLYTSYQNKIDLLNSVSQKEELTASLR